ncbi:MAG: hypothetical protein U9R72_15465 [Chloroflexota bacterium]|nr:hypothetical protein [Chloroflexota bacterium]
MADVEFDNRETVEGVELTASAGRWTDWSLRITLTLTSPPEGA